jgi:hypothetical protein
MLFLITRIPRAATFCRRTTDGTETLQLMTRCTESNSIRQGWTLSKRKGKRKILMPNLLRVEKYDRDLKRWEFMDEEGKREAEKMQAL